jgi:hypothetical protein
MKSGRYILNENNEPVECDDLFAWAAWLQTASLRIAEDQIGESMVSTVFLGLDHSFGGDKPLLYETMVFGGKLDNYCWRTSTIEEALAQHSTAVWMVRSKKWYEWFMWWKGK